MKSILVLFIFIAIITIVIYLVKNQKYYTDLKEKYGNRKIVKYIGKICKICITLVFIVLICKNINDIIFGVNNYSTFNEDIEMFEYYDKKIAEEQKFLKDVMNSKYEINNYNTPYILEGFEYVEGEWNTGYVIQDDNNNQYVWIPCTNKENEFAVLLEKINLDNPSFISKDTCVDETYRDFIISVMKNGGFYVSRFEIGKENEAPVSKYGVEIYKGVTRNEAIEIINKMYPNRAFNCELINGLAYDTTMSWILKSNKIEITERNFLKDDCYSGNKKYNNIYDIMDNSMELTNETSYETVIIRGFCNNDEYEFCNRYNILEDENFFIYNSIISFRTILYK